MLFLEKGGELKWVSQSKNRGISQGGGQILCSMLYLSLIRDPLELIKSAVHLLVSVLFLMSLYVYRNSFYMDSKKN